MTDRRAPDGRGPWARLSAGIVHDGDWLDLNAGGRLCFVTSLALAKATNEDGRFSLRAMIGVQAGALTEKQVRAAAADIVAAGLWEHDGGDRYVVRSYTRWNESVAEQDERRDSKRVGALRTNHKLGRHDERPESDCPDCRSSDAPANGRANATGVASDRSDGDGDGDGDGKGSSSSHGSAARRPTPDDEDDLPTELLRIAGYPRTRPTDGERATVATLLRRGWTPDQLRAMALRASTADVDARAYLAKLLGEALNSDPPATQRATRTGDPMHSRGRDGRTSAEFAAATYVPYTDPTTGESW